MHPANTVALSNLAVVCKLSYIVFVGGIKIIFVFEACTCVCLVGSRKDPSGGDPAIYAASFTEKMKHAMKEEQRCVFLLSGAMNAIAIAIACTETVEVASACLCYVLLVECMTPYVGASAPACIGTGKKASNPPCRCLFVRCYRPRTDVVRHAFFHGAIMAQEDIPLRPRLPCTHAFA